MPSTPRYRLPYGDLDGALTRLDTIIFGGWSPRIAGIVASTRTFAYHGGFNADGSVSADGTIVIPDNSTKYVQRTYDGTVSADASLDLANKIPMAKVTTLSGAITHFEDIREAAFWALRATLILLYGGTAGDLVYSDGAAPAVLGVGAAPDGYVLTLDSGLPSWMAPSGGGGGSSSVWANTVLQMHMDGTNGSTTFTDQKGRTCTPSGNAQISTAQSKFGGASALFDGTGDYVTVTHHKSLNLVAHFTIELWVKTSQIGRQFATLVEKDDGSFGTGSWSLLFNRVTANDGLVYFAQKEVHSDGSFVVSSTTAINDGNWHHIAVVAIGNNYMIFVDGVLEDQASSNAGFGKHTGNLLIGKSVFSTREYNGYMDELRILKGVAAYTTDFTPPTSAFADS